MADHTYGASKRTLTKRQKRKDRYKTFSRIGCESRQKKTHQKDGDACFTEVEVNAAQSASSVTFQRAMDSESGQDSCMDRNVSETDDTDYCPTPRKKHLLHRDQSDDTDCDNSSEEMKIEPCYFIGQSDSVINFVDQFNKWHKCSVFCTGKLVPFKMQNIGLGGGIILSFHCNKCLQREMTFKSTTQVLTDSSRRNQVSLAVHVAMYIAGCHYDKITRSLKLGLGLKVLHEKNFYEIIKMLYPVTRDMLKEMCDEAKEEMKALPNDEIGSFQRAITTSDGAWLTRGFHSKNFTFHVKNFKTQALLYYMHLCQRGGDDICEEELYEGTSKSSEGYAAEKCFKAAADEGMLIEVNWQDGDSSSANGFYRAYPDKMKSKVMLCGGHVTRAHGKQLENLSSMKTFTEGFKSKHRGKHPKVDKVSCVCFGKKHSKGCGCLTENFQRNARINHSLALIEGGKDKDPETYKKVLLELGKYHAQGIHKWDNGECSFHPQLSCSCGTCEEEDELKCEGKQYTSKNTLDCPLHALAYEIECCERAAKADNVIHPDFGRGHSNLPESDHHIFTQFRSKDKNLNRLHYTVSTNLALMQSNLTWLHQKRGITYHWVKDLYTRIGLPVYQDIVEALDTNSSASVHSKEVQQTEETKKRRIERKRARVEEHEERKRWMKEQRAIHTYGGNEPENEDDSEARLMLIGDNQSTDPNMLVTSNLINTSNDVKKCKCGSLLHKRANSKDCPLNKKNK